MLYQEGIKALRLHPPISASGKKDAESKPPQFKGNDMTRRRKESNPDLICTSYKRSTRLLLLEIVAETLLKEHAESIREQYGEGFYCECSICDKGRWLANGLSMTWRSK